MAIDSRYAGRGAAARVSRAYASRTRRIAEPQLVQPTDRGQEVFGRRHAVELAPNSAAIGATASGVSVGPGPAGTGPRARPRRCGRQGQQPRGAAANAADGTGRLPAQARTPAAASCSRSGRDLRPHPQCMRSVRRSQPCAGRRESTTVSRSNPLAGGQADAAPRRPEWSSACRVRPVDRVVRLGHPVDTVLRFGHDDFVLPMRHADRSGIRDSRRPPCQPVVMPPIHRSAAREAHMTFRMTRAQRRKLHDDAEAAGLTVQQLLEQRVWGVATPRRKPGPVPQGERLELSA